ncbi:hypothetical protein ACRALDRAFT_2116378, partial [Sodiomyces alcalophilus JCM 7366]|uniref:uncharacterized protein n=1 Tax=Sodiomyces alcalophilus JCM 7366 TaxID=591952 RepID=UPI0039B52497
MNHRDPEYTHLRAQRRLEHHHVLQMFRVAAADGIMLFNKRGTHRIALPNGASLTLHVRPYNRPVGGFSELKYEPAPVFDFAVGPDTDIIMSSHPPLGVLDKGRDGTLEGCPNLFKAVALEKPKLHCFGHVHENWGAKVVKWHDSSTITRKSTHLTAINKRESYTIELARDFKIDGADSRLEAQRKEERIRHCEASGYVETCCP